MRTPECYQPGFSDNSNHTHICHKPWTAAVLILYVLVYCSVANPLQAQKKTVAEGRTILPFEDDCRFLKEDAPGAENPGFKDKGWQLVNVPHDWTIGEEVDRDNSTGRGGGYFPAGIAWYRKSFQLPKDYADKKVFIEFDGFMANSDVWINGKHLGKRPNGYVSFRYDLTPHLKTGKRKDNVIAVRADNSKQPACRWYTGAGIYRHVRLVISEPVHIDQWGVFITTPEVSEQEALVKAQSRILNETARQQDITLETSILAPDGKNLQTVTRTESVAAGESLEISQDISLQNPQRWDLESPHLYRAVSRVYNADRQLLDEETNTFGIRQFRFDAATGFYLNGRNMKIKGVCLHHDGGALGAAVPLRVWEKRLEQLRQLGVNAIRTSHNPFAPEFYDLCDRMGFLVMDETFDTWNAHKNNADYGYQHYFDEWWEADTRDVVMRDRNHPSIIIYSVGNEIRDNLDNEEGFRKFTGQRDLIHKLDPSRPVTMALFRPNQAKVYDNGFAELMDVVGQNYREDELKQAHLDKPDRKVLGTENGHSRQAWLVLRDNPFMAGQFLWTGFDYLGEADWPEISHDFGLFDRAGGTKPRTFQRQSWWSEEPMVHITRKERNGGVGELVSDWTPADYDTYDQAHLEIYSNCEEVELFLNGKSLGTKTKPEDDAPRNWVVTFEKGTIKAVGKNGGREVATHEMQTAGQPSRIILTADRKVLTNDREDLSFITATVVDEEGIPCVNAIHRSAFLWKVRAKSQQ